jgi:hypothetical protein
MAYEQRKHVTLPDHEAVVSVLQDIAGRLNEVRGIIDRDLKGKILPASDGFPQPGEVAIIDLPTDPPDTVCIVEHPETGHWMMEHPCGGIFIYDITDDHPTF